MTIMNKYLIMRTKIIAILISILVPAYSSAVQPVPVNSGQKRTVRQSNQADVNDAAKKKAEFEKLMRQAEKDVKGGKQIVGAIPAQNEAQRIHAIVQKGENATIEDLMTALELHPDFQAEYFKFLNSDRLTDEERNKIFNTAADGFEKYKRSAGKAKYNFSRNLKNLVGITSDDIKKNEYFKRPFREVQANINDYLRESGETPLTDEQIDTLTQSYEEAQDAVADRDRAENAYNTLKNKFAGCPECTARKHH